MARATPALESPAARAPRHRPAEASPTGRRLASAVRAAPRLSPRQTLAGGGRRARLGPLLLLACWCGGAAAQCIPTGSPPVPPSQCYITPDSNGHVIIPDGTEAIGDCWFYR